MDAGVEPARDFHRPPRRRSIRDHHHQDARVLQANVLQHSLLGRVAERDRLALRTLDPYRVRVHLDDGVGDVTDACGPGEVPSAGAEPHDDDVVLQGDDVARGGQSLEAR
jgi:hypothetical protein